MDFEQDYIMRMIKELIKALGAVLFGKKVFDFPIEESENPTTDNFYPNLLELANQGNINEAENLLYDQLDTSNITTLQIALSFCEHINDYTDEFLIEHNYTRSEIMEGLKYISSQYGLSQIVETLFPSQI